jgi:hypothetical protein
MASKAPLPPSLPASPKKKKRALVKEGGGGSGGGGGGNDDDSALFDDQYTSHAANAGAASCDLNRLMLDLYVLHTNE